MSAFHSSLGQLANRSRSNASQTQEPSLTAKGDQRQFVKHNYTDHSHEQGDHNYVNRYNLECHEHDTTQEEQGGGSSSKQKSIARTLQSPTFPLKLHMILDKIEESDSDMKNAISWLPHGRAFHVRNGDIFKREILAKYFKNCKMSSFNRQINLYGFARLSTGYDTGSYYHEYFLRGRAFLTKNIVRTKVKGTKIRPTSAPKDEPNFYAMAHVSFLMQQPISRPLEVVPSNDQGETSVAFLAAIRCSRQQLISTPLEVAPSSVQDENSIALLAAMREVERITESRNYMYNVPQNVIQSAFLGGMASPQATFSRSLSLSFYNPDGYLDDNLRSPYNDMPRTVNDDIMIKAAVQNELSRIAIHNEMSARTAMYNESSRAAMQNEFSRNVHN